MKTFISLMLIFALLVVVLPGKIFGSEYINEKNDSKYDATKELANKANFMRNYRMIVGPILTISGIALLVSVKNNLDRPQNTYSGGLELFPTLFGLLAGGAGLIGGPIITVYKDIHEINYEKMLKMDPSEREPYAEYCLSHNGSDVGYIPADPFNK